MSLPLKGWGAIVPARVALRICRASVEFSGLAHAIVTRCGWWLVAAGFLLLPSRAFLAQGLKSRIEEKISADTMLDACFASSAHLWKRF